ncbi:isoprenoid synthase domain-containing protein, partial [Flagelloscypha sp. PMI_526]
PPTILTSKVHHNVDRITEELNEFFSKNWPFPTEKSRQKFIGSKFAYMSCAVWPESLDERIYLFALLFLIDDHLDNLSLDEGRAYNAMVFAFFCGTKVPNRAIPIEWITYDVGADMRRCDPVLFPNVVRDMDQFMAAQTDSKRDQDLSFKEYMPWRIDDVGGPLIGSIGLYCSGLILPQDEPLLSNLEHIWARHTVFCNDAWSYDKEVLAAQTVTNDPQATFQCSAVAILMREIGISANAAKRILVMLAREMETSFKQEVDNVLARQSSPELQKYVKILEYQMSGNEIWSCLTNRYKN